MSLLEKAKSKTIDASRLPSSISEEKIEVALAWLKDEITAKQLAYALDIDVGNLRSYLCRILRAAYMQGKIKIV